MAPEDEILQQIRGSLARACLALVHRPGPPDGPAGEMGWQLRTFGDLVGGWLAITARRPPASVAASPALGEAEPKGAIGYYEEVLELVPRAAAKKADVRIKAK